MVSARFGLSVRPQACRVPRELLARVLYWLDALVAGEGLLSVALHYSGTATAAAGGERGGGGGGGGGGIGISVLRVV